MNNTHTGPQIEYPRSLSYLGACKSRDIKCLYEYEKCLHSQLILGYANLKAGDGNERLAAASNKHYLASTSSC